MYKLPASIADQLDAFIEEIFNSFTSIPAVENDTHIQINLSCNLDIANVSEILKEMERLNSIAPRYFLENSISVNN